MPQTVGRSKSDSGSRGRRVSVEAREALNMRIQPELRVLIDHAAEATGKNRTEFVLDAARQAAQNALLDRTLIHLDGLAYTKFVKLLDAPPHPNERLRRTLRTAAPWER